MSELRKGQDNDLENQFQCIQNEYETQITELKQDSTLLPVVTKYENVFLTLKRYHDENARLHKKEADYQLTGQTNKNAERAWALIDAGHQKEEAISSKVSQLQDQLTKLSTQLQEERNNNLKQDEHFKDLIKDRDEQKEKILKLLDQVKQTEKTSRDLHNRNDVLENKVETLRTKNTELLHSLSTKDEQVKNKRNKCQSLEKELDELNGRFDRRSQEYIDLQFSSAMANKKIDDVSKDLRDANKRLEHQTSTIEELRQEAHDLNVGLTTQRKEMTVVTADSLKARKELNLAKSSERKMASENTQLQRQFDNEHKAVLKLQQIAENERSQNRASQQEIQVLHRELDKLKESENTCRRQKTIIERELNIHVEKIHRMEHLMKQADEEAWHQDHTILSLEKQSTSTKDQIKQLQKTILSADKVREKQSNEISQKTKSLEISQTEIIVRNIEIEEMKKEINKKDGELKDQDHISNHLRAEKGKVMKELSEEKKNNNNLRQEISVLRIELKNLRNEILLKDNTLVKTYFEKKNESTRKDQLNNEVAVLRRHMYHRDDAMQKQGIEILNLNSSLKHADQNVFSQKKEYDQLINERDILSTQLIRRNDELALLHEKVKIQGNTLKKGEIQYQERIEELRRLKIKLQDLQRELDAVKGGTNNMSGMNKELMQKDKELLYEKVKVKALSDELQNPLNLHRWRKLEGSDPATFELVQKNESLQKRLIKKAEEVGALISKYCGEMNLSCCR